MRLSELNDLYVKFFGKILLSERAARGQCASSLIAFLSSKIYLHSSTKLFSRLYFNNPCSDVRQPIIFYEYNLHREWTRRLGGVTKLKGNIMSFHRRHFRLTVTFMQMSFFSRCGQTYGVLRFGGPDKSPYLDHSVQKGLKLRYLDCILL